MVVHNLLGVFLVGDVIVVLFNRVSHCINHSMHDASQTSSCAGDNA